MIILQSAVTDKKISRRKRNNEPSKNERERITNDIEKERLRMQAQLENGEQKAEVLYKELNKTQQSYAERLSA